VFVTLLTLINKPSRVGLLSDSSQACKPQVTPVLLHPASMHCWLFGVL
jgi:hypothetical protein